jgi:hypothetical protein
MFLRHALTHLLKSSKSFDRKATAPGLFDLAKVFTEPADASRTTPQGTAKSSPHTTVLKAWLQMTAAPNPHARGVVGKQSTYLASPSPRVAVNSTRVLDEKPIEVRGTPGSPATSPASASEQSRCLHSLRYHLRRHV